MMCWATSSKRIFTVYEFEIMQRGFEGTNALRQHDLSLRPAKK
jgi:hypothetical protein